MKICPLGAKPFHMLLHCIIIANHLKRGTDPTPAVMRVSNIQVPLKW